MPFSDILGHQQQVKTLRQGLEKNRLHHALLFLGPEGVGKRTVALSLAMAIQCRQKVGDSCGGCPDCSQVRNGHHPDARAIEPLPGKKEISIQQVRELQRELSFRPFCGRRKIALVDPATLMNAAAQNALLKTLEEPPRDSMLVLISTDAGGLLPTLLSRCVRLSFAPVPVELVAEFLAARKKMKVEEANVLAAMSLGSLGVALRLEAEGLLEKRKVWAEKICSLGPGNYRGALSLAEEIGGAREDSLAFLEWLEGWYRDILITRATGDCRAICNPDIEKNIRDQAETHHLERILFLLSQVGTTRARIHRNVNRRLAFESLFAAALKTD